MLLPVSPPHPAPSPVSRPALSPVSRPAPRLLLRLLLQRGQTAQQGLTIMECLVAVMLIGITIAMVTPPLLIATASRVQSRRSEQAQQVAQDEIDRINTMVQRGLHQNSLLPIEAQATNLKTVAPPTAIARFLKTTRVPTSPCPPTPGQPYAGFPRYDNSPIPINQALAIDVDGNCTPDFFMQVIRNGSQFTPAESQRTATAQRPARFDLGVRVYSNLVDTNGTLVSGRLSVPPVPASLGLTIGQGQQATNPLSVVYKALAWGERSEVLCQYARSTDRTNLSGCN